MKDLRQTTSEASQSSLSQEKYELLSRAFEMFSQETSRLESAYISLKKQFKELNIELQETNGQLQHKVLELDEIMQYLKSILDNINQGILFIDVNGRIATYNQAAEAILGVDCKRVMFNLFWDHFADEIFGFSIQKTLQSHVIPKTLNIDYASPCGRHVELEVSMTEVPNTHLLEASDIPSSLGLLIMLRDVTDIKRLQLQASRNDRMKALGNMAAQMAHEIRNPLGGIKGFASLLKRDLQNQPQLQQMAGHIVEGTDNLSRLVTQVLDYARPHHPHFEKVDLLIVLKELKEHIVADESMNKARIEILITPSSGAFFAFVDQQLFKSAMFNLIVNAVQAMPHGGKLLLSLSVKQNEIVLTVADTGVGISSENIGKMFSPFFTTKPDGNGFGLAEVHKIIQTHEGTIDVSSTEGVGTSFVIKLPLKLS